MLSRLVHGSVYPIVLVSIFILVVVSRTESARSSSDRTDRECRQIENQLKDKGFSYPWWDTHSNTPSPTPSGCALRDKSLKCCQQNFDTASQRREMSSAFSQKWFGTKLNSAGEVFKIQKTRFDVTFKALLQRARTDFHSMFEKT